MNATTGAILDQFEQAMRDAGIEPPAEIVPDGRLHRFPTNGKACDLAGWYVFHSDGIPAGAFGCWRAGISEAWCARDASTMTAQERADHRRRIELLRQQREAAERERHAEAAELAWQIWESAAPAPAEHPYLTKKRIHPHGLRVHSDGRLIVPLADAEGEVMSLEFIDASGAKRFLPSGRKHGGMFLIGEIGNLICIAEGYATAASVHEATGHPVAVAFDAGNLLPVAQALRATYPGARILLCADNDPHGVGQAKAKEAAEAVGGMVVIPDFGTERPDQASDFNDISMHRGTSEIRRQIEQALMGGYTATKRPDPGELQPDQSDEDSAATDTAAPPVFPDAAWRGPFRAYREAMAGTSEAPDAAHFAGLWAVAAALLRRRVWFYYAFAHYPNVYLVLYGTTGDSKTSASRQALRLLPESGAVKVARGIGSGEAMAEWMQQPQDGAPVSHLLYLEEVATLLTRSRWDGSTLLPFLTETFDAPSSYEARFRKNPVLVEQPTPTLLASTTPAWFWKAMQELDIHGGFGNRIFYLSGAPKAPVPLPKKPDAAHLLEVQEALARLGQIAPTELALDAGAVAVWEPFYHAWKQTQWTPLTAAAVKRVPAYTLKLAMIYAAFEGTVPLITRPQLEAALLVGQYGASCTRALMENYQRQTRQGHCEAAVLRAVADRDLPPWKIHRTVSGRYSAEDINRAVRSLVAAGTLRETAKTKRGEPIYGPRTRKTG